MCWSASVKQACILVKLPRAGEDECPELYQHFVMCGTWGQWERSNRAGKGSPEKPTASAQRSPHCWQGQTLSISTQPTTTADRDSSSPGGSVHTPWHLQASSSGHLLSGYPLGSRMLRLLLHQPVLSYELWRFLWGRKWNWVLPVRAWRQLLLPKRLYQGCKADFNIPAWGKAWLSAHLDYKHFGSENC